MENNRSSTGLKQITRAQIAQEPFVLKRDKDVEKYKQKLIEAIDPYPEMWKLNFYDKLSMWISKGARYSKLIIIIINLITKIGGTMATSNDKKTTRTGLVKGIIAAIVSVIMLFFSVDIPTELQSNLAALVVLAWGIIESVQGYFTNKSDKVEEV
jgi:hypothetical protein